MTATAQAFGFVPVKSGISGNALQTEAFTIASALAANIFTNDPVCADPANSGTIINGTAAVHLFGVFDGCEFTDSGGAYHARAYWPTGQALASNTTCTAYVWRNPFIEYAVQSAGSVVQTSLWYGADMVVGSGNLLAGSSTATLNASVTSGATIKQFRIANLQPLLNNAWGDAFTIVRVTLNNMSGFWPQGGASSWV